jgi:hypothetical protein
MGRVGRIAGGAVKRLLLNYLCRAFVGHSVEALRYARGLLEANPGTEVHLALSDRCVPEIAQGCPWLTRVYPIHLADLPDLGHLPTDWDYIVDDLTIVHETDTIDSALLDAEALALRRYYQLTAEVLTAKARGTLSPSLRLPKGLAYRPQAQVTLSVPAANRSFVERYRHTGPKIGVLLGGSFAYQWYPDVSSWIKILGALRESLPAARFHVTGVRQPGHGQTRTAGYTDQDIAQVLTSGPDTVDCYDIGFWNQVALMESCDLIIAPRTGFAALALCVGTPWLTISGGDWPEYFFNGVPFYPVLPDDPDYPYRAQLYPEDTPTKIPSMRPANLDRKIPEIVEAASLLLNPDFTYAASVQRYRENIARANVNRGHVPLPTDPTLASF